MQLVAVISKQISFSFQQSQNCLGKHYRGNPVLIRHACCSPFACTKDISGFWITSTLRSSIEHEHLDASANQDSTY